jgi:hypothetical protein
LPLRSPSRKYRTALAGGAATVLAAIVIAAPAGAAVDYFHSAPQTTSAETSFSWGAEQVGLNFTQPGQDVSFNFTRPGG